jgi:hypothetical protein
VGQAGLRALERWVAEGIAPPAAERLHVQGDGFATDEHGVARGGVRTPWVDVPTAVLSGLGQSGAGFAFLFGTTRPFDAAALAGRYPGGRDEYLVRFGSALTEAIDGGFLLEEDRVEIEEVAAASFPA